MGGKPRLWAMAMGRGIYPEKRNRGVVPRRGGPPPLRLARPLPSGGHIGRTHGRVGGGARETRGRLCWGRPAGDLGLHAVGEIQEIEGGAPGLDRAAHQGDRLLRRHSQGCEQGRHAQGCRGPERCTTGASQLAYLPLLESRRECERTRLDGVAVRRRETSRVQRARGCVELAGERAYGRDHAVRDRKSTRLNSSHITTSYADFCLKKKTQ